MKPFSTLAVLLLVFSVQLNAKTWRVNNNVGIVADFTTLSAAVNAATSGDTIHVEASATMYEYSVHIAKKLVILGPGYYLAENSPAVANAKTQVNPNPAFIGYIYLDPGSNGSVVSGLSVYEIDPSDDNLTIERNLVQSAIYPALGTNSISNDTIRQNVINTINTTYTGSNNHINNLLVYNNIFTGYSPVDFSRNNGLTNANGFFINNDFVYGYSSAVNNPASLTSANFVYQNNIFGSVNFGAYLTSNVFFNNICLGTGIPAGNNNQQNIDVAANVYNDFSPNAPNGFSSDGRYRLKSNATPAHNAGLLNGVAIDCGAFGGPAPYILSGLPSIPAIYALSIPSQVNTGTATLNISFSSAAH